MFSHSGMYPDTALGIKHSHLVDSVLRNVGCLLRNPDLKELEVMEAVENVLFSQFSDGVGKVVDSIFPKALFVLDEDLSQDRGGCREFPDVEHDLDVSDVNIRCEPIPWDGVERETGEPEQSSQGTA
ncbi:hypothetical protein H2200_001240 [Cladophialophora chaetospira]|uniref:Uncharacterized protein n=1 Tax=Cladophialophora chaetospira TaxID=386627 RepID=A0AA38XKM4_9EURO|nr:hypothetical protein H2200_001240 [Cladophialophora chaetospira]